MNLSQNAELLRLDCALADVILIPIQMVKTKLNLQIRSGARLSGFHCSRADTQLPFLQAIGSFRMQTVNAQ